MNKKEVRDAIFTRLTQILVPAGFKGKKADASFRRRTATGFQEVRVPLWDFNPIFAFSVIVGMRVDVIQVVSNPLSSTMPEFWDESTTVAMGPAYFLGHDLRPEVRTEEEIETAMGGVEALFRSQILPLLDTLVTLADVERLLNASHRKKFVTRRHDLAMAGVIAAALCQRPDVAAIVEQHRAALRDGPAPELHQFEAAVTHVNATLLAH